MRDRSTGYEILRQYVRFAFWLTHKRIVINGRENIPVGKPIIFAANHQNALMDPLALSCTNPLQTLWLARADIFKNKLARPALKFMKMLPIYRIRDGKENLSNNEEVFNQVTQVLENRQSIALFPEAAHSGKRQMLVHRKAIPRIALEAEAKNNFTLELQIVPVGIYYDHYWKFNRTLVVQYGKPIGIDGYRERYAENGQNAMLSLRDEIRECLLPLTMQINSVEHYVVYEQIRMLAGEERTQSLTPGRQAVLEIFKYEQWLMERVELLEQKDSVKFEALITATTAFAGNCKNAGLTGEKLAEACHTTGTILILKVLFALVTLPLLAFGLLFSFLPYYLPRILLRRKVKDPAFLSTFFFVPGLLIFPLFYLAESALVAWATHSLSMAGALFVTLPFAGKLAYNLLQFGKSLLQLIRLKIFDRRLFGVLAAQRNTILETLHHLN